jgi:Ca2+-dependent lipid-binding protein
LGILEDFWDSLGRRKHIQELKNADLLSKSDPYLRIFMLPGRHVDLKTKTKANTLNPIYNETFSFTVGVGADGARIVECTVQQEFILSYCREY